MSYPTFLLSLLKRAYTLKFCPFNNFSQAFSRYTISPDTHANTYTELACKSQACPRHAWPDSYFVRGLPVTGTACTDFSIRLVTRSGWETMTTWLDFTSSVVARIR